MKFCPECGEKLEAHHKFCPNCGAKIIRETTGEQRSDRENITRDRRVVICPNCGEENSPDAPVCESCGYKLVKGKKTQVSSKKKEAGSSGKEPAGKGINRSKNISADKENEIDKTKVIYVAVGVLAILMLVLYTSGIFDPVPTTVVNPNVQKDVSSGVNLNNMQRINELETKLKNEPGNTTLLLELAHLKNDSGLYENAIRDYKKYLETNPADADARIDMGVCYYNLKQYDNAMTEMKKALEYKPDHQIGHLNLGIVNLAAGNIEESKIWLSKAVSINPESDIGKKAQELLQSH